MITGNGNPFAAQYSDQCTYWAQQRYHQLTGVWSPCTGNGAQWSGQASSAGWSVSPIPVVPSIICLQAGVQGADRNYGHVGVVEKINSDGSIYTSNYNAYPHYGDRVVVYLNFKSGPGVSFISLPDGYKPSIGAQIYAFSSQIATGAATTFALTSNATIAQALYVIDQFLIIKNPFDVDPDTIQDTISVAGISASFSDPVKWIYQVMGNIFNDTVALIIRIILIAVGIYILFRVIDHYIQISEKLNQAGQTALKLMPLLT